MAAESAALDDYRHVEARTRDGRRMEVAANMSAPPIPRAKKLLSEL
jgi:phosphoenolpyruvate-protein kinase (PTS system EI component)